MIQNISKFCDEIDVGGKTHYISGHPYSTDCEPTWYAQNGTVLGTKLSLFLDTCEPWIQLLIRCFQSEEMYEYIFQVINRITPTGETKPTKTDTNELGYLWLLLILVPLVLYFVCRKQGCSPKYDDGNAVHPNGDAVVIPLASSTPQNKEGEENIHLNGAAVMNRTPKKQGAPGLNGHTNGDHGERDIWVDVQLDGRLS